MTALLRTRAARDVVTVLVAVFGVGSLAMLLAHVSPIVGFGALFDGAFGTPEEIAETLVQTTNLLFPALGIAVAFRAGLFNIGAEGQLMLGGFAAGWLGAQFPLPGYVAIPMVLLGGARRRRRVGCDPRLSAREARRERSDLDADAQLRRDAAHDVSRHRPAGSKPAAARKRPGRCRKPRRSPTCWSTRG